MNEFTNNIKKRSEKLKKLGEELENIDMFRESTKRWEGAGLTIVSTTPNGNYPREIHTKNFEGLDENIKGLIEVAFNKRHEEIRKILENEFGGACTETESTE